MYAKRLPGTAVTLMAATLVVGCAVGPGFKCPDPPQVDRYTRRLRKLWRSNGTS
jgi:hypothetical protein